VSGSLQRSEPATGGPEAAPGPGQANTVPAAPGGQQVRILILEDEAWDAELAQRLMADASIGFTAVVVDTEAGFVEQLTAFRPDIILSDFSLPGFSGEIALKIARNQCPDVPFIIWSSALGDEAAVKLIRQGATDYILKDRPARLPSAILRALAEVAERARLAQFEGQLIDAQRLASLGQLSAAQEAVSLTRQMLAAARQEIAAKSASGSTVLVHARTLS
jgi:DNA-binding NtrC family response regulator